MRKRVRNVVDYKYLYEILGKAIDECFGYLEKEDGLSALLVLMNAKSYCAELEEEETAAASGRPTVFGKVKRWICAAETILC